VPEVPAGGPRSCRALAALAARPSARSSQHLLGRCAGRASKLLAAGAIAPACQPATAAPSPARQPGPLHGVLGTARPAPAAVPPCLLAQPSGQGGSAARLLEQLKASGPCRHPLSPPARLRDSTLCCLSPPPRGAQAGRPGGPQRARGGAAAHAAGRRGAPGSAWRPAWRGARARRGAGSHQPPKRAGPGPAAAGTAGPGGGGACAWRAAARRHPQVRPSGCALRCQRSLLGGLAARSAHRSPRA
jgi:hypothetical protein